MFERYTERARRVIFFARYEASKLGGSEITPEHLMLGLFREDQGLRGMLGASGMEEIRRVIEQETRAGSEISTSVDLPLNMSAKRVLAHAADASERLNQIHIGTPHMVMGLLREPSRAAELLTAHGVTMERAHEAAVAVQPDPASTPAPEAAVREQMLKRLRQAAPGTAGMVFGGTVAAALTSGFGETIIESHRFHHGHEVTLIEKLLLSEDGKTLHVTIEVRGPKGSQTWSGDFEV